MKITVLLFGKLRSLAARETELSLKSGAKFVDLMESLATTYDDSFREEIRKIEQYHVLVSGQHFDPVSGAETALKDGDVVAISPYIGGG